MLTQQCSHNNAHTRLQQDSNQTPTSCPLTFHPATVEQPWSLRVLVPLPPPLVCWSKSCSICLGLVGGKKKQNTILSGKHIQCQHKKCWKKHLSSGRGRGTFSPGHIDTAVNETAFGNAFGHFRHDKNPKPILGANALFLFFGDFRNLFLRLNFISH